nr:hypothetical protein [Tanacetum cinerariifolium]
CVFIYVANERINTDNELFLDGDADYLMHDGGWIRKDDHVDCENNVDMDCGSNNNADGEVTSPTFVPNYHNKEMSTSMQKVGQKGNIGPVDINVNNVEASRDERCNKGLLLNATSLSHIDNAKVEEVRKTIEIGCLIGLNMIGKEHDVSAIIGDNVVEQ